MLPELSWRRILSASTTTTAAPAAAAPYRMTSITFVVNMCGMQYNVKPEVRPAQVYDVLGSNAPADLPTTTTTKE